MSLLPRSNVTLWGIIFTIVAIVFLGGVSVGYSAHAEELAADAVLPTCTRPDERAEWYVTADSVTWRCVRQKDAGPVLPEDFRDCTLGGHAVRCDKGLDP